MKGTLGCALMALASGMSSGSMAQTASGVDWSGVYAGGLLGVTDSKSDASMVTGRLQYFDATDARQIARVGKNKLDQLGISGGLVLGYGKQYGNVLVGIEASATSLSFDKEHVAKQEMDANPGFQSTVRQSVSADWIAGLRLRLGWAERNWLAYVSAGIAATRVKLNSTYTDNAFTGFSRGSTSTSVKGASIGFGGEYALDQKWSFRGEYLYTKFDRISTESDVTSTNNPGGNLIHKADLDNHSLFMGAIYHF